MAELAQIAPRLSIRDVPDESPYNFKCRELLEIIGKVVRKIFGMESVGWAVVDRPAHLTWKLETSD